MTPERPWAARLLEHRLRQPDARSCGAASLVLARALRDEGYARLLVDGVHPVTGWGIHGATGDRFRAETLAMHRRVTGPVDVFGRLQLPWPQAFGTPPWAVAHQLSTPRLRYSWRPTLAGLPALAITRAVTAGRPVPLYVGNLWSPRHVVLVVAADDDRLRVYDPAEGHTGTLSGADLAQGRLPFGRWSRAWFAVLPGVGHDPA